ncbi:hypothetical protein C7D74_33280, partial [Klebsiella pneumoniae]
MIAPSPGWAPRCKRHGCASPGRLLAADWQGLHTIMPSWRDRAQPGLGATMQKTWLRIAGAAAR